MKDGAINIGLAEKVASLLESHPNLIELNAFAKGHYIVITTDQVRQYLLKDYEYTASEDEVHKVLMQILSGKRITLSMGASSPAWANFNCNVCQHFDLGVKIEDSSEPRGKTEKPTKGIKRNFADLMV